MKVTGERALEVKAEETRGDEDGQRSERAVMLLEFSDRGGERGFEVGLERAADQASRVLAWRLPRNIVSRIHSR